MILAVDPGIAKCGWAIVRPTTGAIVELGVLVADRDEAYDVSTDRVQRADLQAHFLGMLALRYSVTTIAAEGVTLGGPVHVKLAMSVGLHLSWGVLTTLARERGLDLIEVMPKVWQHAVQPGRKKIHYPSLEAEMAKHVGPQVGAQLLAIPPSERNHALDACGIGMLAALQPQLATRINQRKAEAG